MRELGFQFEATDPAESSPIDINDALEVNRAWCRMPECPEKRYLAERFVLGRSGEGALRGVRRRVRRWYRWRAYQMLWNRLTKAQTVVSSA